MPTIGKLILLTDGTRLDAPEFLPCDGRAVKQSDYPALYNVIGTSFGSTTNDDFKLPGEIPLPAGLNPPASYYICMNGTDPSLPAPDAVYSRVERFAFQPSLPLPTGWDRPANQQTIPSNYHPCDGSSLLVSQNPHLFYLIENSYGGEHPSTFCLPNVSTDPNFYWGMPHNGYCIAQSDALWPSEGNDDFVGQIILMPNTSLPYYTDFNSELPQLPCNGGLLNYLEKQRFDTLFALIGFTYGGDGVSTFALPNLSPPPGLEGHEYFIVWDGYFPG